MARRLALPRASGGPYSLAVVPRTWDVVVVGAGPAGCSAALAAAKIGAQVLVLERHQLPRYKMCGGGLIGLTLAALPQGFTIPARNHARRVTFSYDLGRSTTRDAGQTVIPMVMRDAFDAQLAEAAVAAGAQVAPGTSVERVEQPEGQAGDGDVIVHSTTGAIRARALIGADGSASTVARTVGARYRQVDLGLEVELDVPPAVQQEWAERVLIDFGRVRGGYGWIFPKGDRLTVGAIAAKGLVTQQRAYLADLIDRHQLTHLPVAHEGGHLTRCRAADSPLGAGRILLAGDAAGLLEPWTREGISFALRSGQLAGAAAARMALSHAAPEAALRDYATAVAADMGQEMAVGFHALAAYERHPKAFYRALAQSNRGWSSFVRLARGETTLARAGQHPVVRFTLDRLAGGVGAG